MANQKPKKSGKKNPSNSEPKKELKESKATVTTKETVVTTATTEKTTNKNPLAGFFARKYGENENILTIFKTPKIWGALLAEVLGTMLIVAVLLTMGPQPMYFWIAALGIYTVFVGLSGANLNPLVTAGMMATRRMSAIRGVLYMLAQLLGAWLGLIIMNAFRLSSGTTQDLAMMDEVTGDTFWAVALVELLGAIVIAFCFARALRFARKSPLTFAFTVASAITLAYIFGIVIAQGFFYMSNSFIFNPVAALMYQILPTAAENFGELAQLAGLAAAAYIVFPVLGGVLGFFLSDITTRLSDGGYHCEYDEACCTAVAKK